MPGRRWTESELQLLGTAPDAAIACRIGRRPDVVARKRSAIGIPAASPLEARRFRWTAQRVAMLGTASDAAIATRLGLTRRTVLLARNARGIRAFSPKNRPKHLSD